MQPTTSASTDTGSPASPTTPGKHTPLVLHAEDSSNGASTGQILVMFAIFLIGMLGMLGLATDVGYMLAGRRATQGAADAGARMIARYTADNPTSALPEVQGAMGDNGFGAADSELKGPDGCLAGAAAPYDCVMILPIVAKGESGTTKRLAAVGYASFQITSGGDERINATLLDDYIVSGDGTANWCSSCGGVVVVRLIW